VKLAPVQLDFSRKGRVPLPVWWAGYLVISLWAQELSGGFDFLTPGLLVCMQSGQWWSAAWMALVWVLVQEGVGSLVFGVSILFYAGMFAFFLLSRWLLEPENPLFILFFSLILSIWSWCVLSGAVDFQELSVRMPASLSWISKQWLSYVLYWSAVLIAFRRWGRYGRV